LSALPACLYLMMAKFWIGCSGFYNAHWKEVFYPPDVRRKDWFSFYSRHLNSLEINTTFYKFPSSKSLEKWCMESPEEFKFSVKAPRVITHFKKMSDCEQEIDDFYLACEEGLKEKLGCLLFQFPPSFNFTRERLQLITSQLKPGFRNVVEFRHDSWWNEEVSIALESANIHFCQSDHPALPQRILNFNKFTYVRLHGNPVLFHSNYEDDFLHLLKERLLQNTELEAYIYFNNTASTSGILNALQLKNFLGK